MDRLRHGANQNVMHLASVAGNKGQLVEFVRRVLQVIPASMFDILKEIIGIQTNRLQEVPTRLEKEHLKEYAPSVQR